VVEKCTGNYTRLPGQQTKQANTRPVPEYFGDVDPRFGDIAPPYRLRFKEHDRLTNLPFFS